MSRSQNCWKRVTRRISVPVMTRAQLLRMMKTVVTILERCKQKSIRRMAQFLSEQLVEVMPELKEIAPWPAVGRRRTSRDLGQAARQRLTSVRYVDFDSDMS